MIFFDVYLNGEKLCRAGMKELVVMACHVDYVEPKFDDDNRLSLHVGGLYLDPSGAQAHPSWINRVKLNEGDEITFRIVNSDVADDPVSEIIYSRERLEEDERKYYETVKANSRTAVPTTDPSFHLHPASAASLSSAGIASEKRGACHGRIA